ncbi:uncharacterized protein [Watersipora subatra]|uniref:uncharacterized protein n=1 Tax=Watersipora subatra TaxID=2589382 RepID=UPI00355ADD63
MEIRVPIFISIIFALVYITDLSLANPGLSQDPICGGLNLTEYMSMVPPCPYARLAKNTSVHGCPKYAEAWNRNEHPGADCVPNFCNIASGTWFDDTTRRPLSREQCCGTNPECRLTCPRESCAEFPQAKCEVNSCGPVCNLYFTVERLILHPDTHDFVTIYIDVSDKCGGGISGDPLSDLILGRSG